MKKITLGETLGLEPRHAVFVVEYLKDFAVQRASEAAGYAREHGYKLLQRDDVAAVIEKVIHQRLELNMLDADAVLFEMWDNHMIARQLGNITASNTALNMLAKHKRVDAFAADKIKVSTDADVVDRLIAARRRVSASEDDCSNDEVSFF